MRLIDADVLQQRIENELEMANLRQNGYAYCLFQHVLGYISECPTVYDVDRVIEQIEAKDNDLPLSMFAYQEADHEGIYNKGASDAYETAIEIVKAGIVF